MSSATTAGAPPRTAPAKKDRRLGRWIIAALVAVALAVIVLGTEVVPDDDPRVQAQEAFDPAVFGVEEFPKVQEAVTERAVDAATLGAALAEDPAAAATEYGIEGSTGTVYSTTFTGVVGEGQSGIYEVAVDGVPESITIRVQTGPAINGTDLRDATGEYSFDQFTNQIEFQNAGAALNDEMKAQVLEGVDTTNLQGSTITVTGAFTAINPEAWLVTPVSLEVQ